MMSLVKRITTIVVSASVVATLVAACSVEDATPLPRCDRGDSALIAAQSVPSAEMLPCFTHLPLGWEVDTVGITHDGTSISFDSDRAGHHAAALDFLEACDSTGSTEQPSGHDDVERFARTEQEGSSVRTSIFHVFAGGCVTWTFDVSDKVPLSELTALEESLVLMPRSVVRDNVVDSFIDREL